MVKVCSVSEINSLIKSSLAAVPALQRIQVRGELSNFKRYESGHCYFTLKDGQSVLKCVMFRSRASLLRFRPDNGQQVIAAGRIEVYERDGAYQLYADNMFLDGVGSLMEAYEALRQKLRKEGLFDLERKQKPPLLPATVGIITSASGAVLHDIITVAKKRNPAVRLVFFPVRVQGGQAPPELVNAIRKMNAARLADVLIIGRGGGSLEELWAFNDERVARAVAASQIPVISAVGHETDVTLCDFAADVRAATPSQAAELAVPDRAALLGEIAGKRKRLDRGMNTLLELLSARLKACRRARIFARPDSICAARLETADKLRQALRAAMTRKLLWKEQNLRTLAGKMDSLSPLSVLARGYSLTTHPDGGRITGPDALCPGGRLKTVLSFARVYSTIQSVEEDTRGGFAHAQEKD